MYKLVAEEGYKWIAKDYIASNVVWLMEKKEALKYTLVDENFDPVKPIDYDKYLVEVKSTNRNF